MKNTTIKTDASIHSHHKAAERLIVHEFSDSWTRYLIINRKKLLTLYKKLRQRGLSMFDAYQELLPYWHGESYGGPGRPFTRCPFICHKSRRYVVWCQSGGWDV